MRLPDANQSALGMLRVLLACTLIVPVLLFVVASWLNYRATLADAQRELVHSTEVAREHAAKLFDAQNQLIDRVNDLVRGMDSDAIQRAELTLHDAFARIVARLPQVQGVLLIGADGHPLVSAGLYPIPGDVNVSGRDYFKAVMDGFDGPYVSNLQFGDLNGVAFFGLARPWVGADGGVKGVVDVAVLPAFFQEFYAVLVGEGRDGGAGNVLTLIRADGQMLMSYPPLSGPPPRAPATGPFVAAITAKPLEGTYESRSIVDPTAPERLFAYRRVSGYPVYVVAGRSRSEITAEWRATMASHLVFGLPATLALFAVTWTALVRTRREERALAVARGEMVRRQTAEAALLKAQRLEAVGQVTGGVAHDFNNLLTIILGGAELLGRRANDPAAVRRVAEQITLAAKRGGEVTQQLLVFSRRQLVHPEVIDLNQTLHNFSQLLDRAATEAVHVEFNLAADLNAVRLDLGHFEAAILNLVGNARDAMPNGGRIIIATDNVVVGGSGPHDLDPGQYVRVSVRDSGAGMDAATAAKAFEPFFTTKEIGKGTGLGLSQVYGFVKQAGGDARIITALGEGTTVELMLPRTYERLTPPVTEPAPVGRARDGEVVLVVEDEPAVLGVAVEILSDLGYETLVASTPALAMALLRGSQRIDVLFSDVVMPGGLSGAVLARDARELRPCLKVLLTSGYVGDLNASLPTDVPLLAKPYDRAQLALRLRAVLHDEVGTLKPSGSMQAVPDLHGPV